MLIGTWQRSHKLEEKPVLIIGNKELKKVTHSKTFGVVVDENLTWFEHVELISKKVTSGLDVIKRVCPYVPTDTLITMYNSIVKSHLDYC